MKIFKQNILIWVFLIGTVAFNACKKDLSTLDTHRIEGVAVDTTGMGILNVFQFDHLVVNPKLATGLKDEALTYQWRINIDPGDTTSSVVGTAKDLDVEIKLKPNDSQDYYQLWYEVTDKNTGLKYISTWKLNIRNSIGEGLVIAETAADGISSDISHIMSPLVTPDYTAESIRHKIFSTINGSTIPGLIKQMRYTNIKSVNSLLAITDNSIVKVNNSDYTLGGMNNDLFFSHTGEFKPQKIAGLSQVDVYVGNGKLTSGWLEIGSKFGLPLDVSYTIPTQLAINANLYDSNVTVNFYDDVSGKFVYIPSLSSYGDKTMYPYESVLGKAFDPGNLPGKINIAAGLGAEEEFVHVLKDKSTGKIGLYTFQKAGFDYDNYVVIPSLPKGAYDITNAPGITEATKFAFMDNQRVLYYATSTKVYAILYGAATPTFEERYTAPVGETITTLQVYQQSDYPYGEGPYLSTNNNQLIMSTYGTEGKVYLLPLKNIGLGNVDLPKVKTFIGFGKITAITTQK